MEPPTCQHDCFCSEVHLAHVVIVVVAGQHQKTVLDLFRNRSNFAIHFVRVLGTLERKEKHESE